MVLLTHSINHLWWDKQLLKMRISHIARERNIWGITSHLRCGKTILQAKAIQYLNFLRRVWMKCRHMDKMWMQGVSKTEPWRINVRVQLWDILSCCTKLTLNICNRLTGLISTHFVPRSQVHVKICQEADGLCLNMSVWFYPKCCWAAAEEMENSLRIHGERGRKVSALATRVPKINVDTFSTLEETHNYGQIFYMQGPMYENLPSRHQRDSPW